MSPHDPAVVYFPRGGPDVLSGLLPSVTRMDPFVAYHETHVAARLVAGDPPDATATGRPLYVCVSTRHEVALACLTSRLTAADGQADGSGFDAQFLRVRGRTVRFPDDDAFAAIQLHSGELVAFLLVRPSEISKARHWFATRPESMCSSAPTVDLCRVRHR